MKMQIGDEINGCIIFYIESNGLKGLMAANADIGGDDGVEFGLEQSNLTTCETLGKGAENTLLIINNYQEAPAANLCASLNLNGFKDWHLPSKEELNLLYINLHLKGMGCFSGNGYWSSSLSGMHDDYNVNEVWYQDFSDGKVYSGIYDKKNVRPIRAF